MRRAVKTLIISVVLTVWLGCPAAAWAVTLVWDANTDPVDGYRIYYGTAEGAPTESLDVGLATTYDLDQLDLSENIQYAFYVAAYNAAGESTMVGPVVYTPADTTPPTPPNGVEMIPGARLTWQPNPETDLRGYNLYYGTASRSYGPPMPVGNQTTFTVSGLEEGAVYYFAVSAVDHLGNESGFSEEIVYRPPSVVASDEEGAATTPTAVILKTSPETTTSSPDIVTPLQRPIASRASSVALAGSAVNSSLTVTDAEGAVDGDMSPGADSPEATATPLAESTASQGEPSGDPAGAAGTTGSMISEASVDGGNATGTTAARTKIDRPRASDAGSAVDNGSTPVIAAVRGAVSVTVETTDQTGTSAQVDPTEADRPADTRAPMVRITSPAGIGRYFWGAATLDIGGTAGDDVGVAKVTWRNSKGEIGVCSGAEAWSASRIPLKRWWNKITVTAFDHAGNASRRQLTVFRWL